LKINGKTVGAYASAVTTEAMIESAVAAMQIIAAIR
jgi:hypothetical protein